jgi:hypothetical protein
MDPEVGFEFNSELGTSNPELDFELDFELNPELGTSNSELNFELRKTTGKQPENFPLPKALSLHLADIALSQLADKPSILLQPYNLAEPEKSYLPQAENSHLFPAAAPGAPAPDRSPQAPDLATNNQQLTTDNCLKLPGSGPEPPRPDFPYAGVICDPWVRDQEDPRLFRPRRTNPPEAAPAPPGLS